MNTSQMVLVVVGSVAMIFFMYFWLHAATQPEIAFERWVAQNGYRVIHRELVGFPFTRAPDAVNYHITVEDRDGNRKSGRLSLGHWNFIVFDEKIEVQWDN